MADFQVGDSLLDSIQFAVDGAPTDPSAVTVAVLAPDGTTTTFTYGASVAITRTGVGAFMFAYVPTMAGSYVFTWEGTDPARQQSQTAFWVYAGWGAKPLLVTANEVINYTNETATEDDKEFCSYIIEALQDELELRMNRALTVRPFVETHALDWRWTPSYELQLYKQPVESVSQVLIAGQVLDPGAYQVMHYGIDFTSGLSVGLPMDWWGIGVEPIVVTYRGGYNGQADVPGARMLMLRTAATEFLARRNNVQGVKRLSVGRGIQYDFGSGLEGFSDEDLAGLSRLRQRVVAI